MVSNYWPYRKAFKILPEEIGGPWAGLRRGLNVVEIYQKVMNPKPLSLQRDGVHKGTYLLCCVLSF